MDKMKKLIIIILPLLLLNNCYAVFGLITKDEVHNELNAIKLDNAKINTNVNTDLSLLKSQIGSLELKIGQINTEFSAQVSAINNSKTTKTSVGGNQTNDTEMIKELIAKNESMVREIVNTYRGIIVVIIVQMCGLVLAMIKLYGKMFEISEGAEEKMDKAQMELISALAMGRNSGTINSEVNIDNSKEVKK